ncbi:TIGR02269 family lipoprotein [Corallococcus coralloides]|nr:TIGR02269 family lipoprotein [Corallococcus coralloides]
MRTGFLLLVAWLAGCATARAPVPEWSAAEDAPQPDDACVLSLQCDGDICGLYECHDAPPGRVVRTFSGAPVFVAPGGTAQRNWGSAQRLPGDSLPVLVFRWYPRETLPSEVKRRQAMAEWASRPKERHHIFPQAMKAYFQSKGINVHDYVIAIDAEVHKRIHREADRGPWNTEWMSFRQRTLGRATKPMHFEQASLMIQKFDLFGLTMTYWQGVDLAPIPEP